MQELRLRKNMHKFIAVQDVYFTLVYMFSSSTVVSQLNYFSITQNLFSQPRTFFWREFLKAYRELKNLTFRGEINKLHVQIDFFAPFTTNRVDDDGITTMFAPYPCRLQIVPSLDSNFQLSNNVITEDTQITIIPKYVNANKSKKNEDFERKKKLELMLV